MAYRFQRQRSRVLQRSGSSAGGGAPPLPPGQLGPPSFPSTPAGGDDRSIPRVARVPPPPNERPSSAHTGRSVGWRNMRSSPAPSATGWPGLDPPRGEPGRRPPGAFQNSHYNQDFDPHEEIRIVLIGKTGNGKSASGNTILNEMAFKSVLSPLSVTSMCKKARGEVNGRRVAVIDTPGIFDTKYKKDEVVRKLKKCISLSAPGPHVFVIVIKLDKFTEEEKKAVELLQTVFGDKAADYSLVLFTHGDRLGHTRIEDFFRQSKQLSHLIAKCNWRYHVFNNIVPNNSQVPQLLEKIINMVYANGGTFYTNEMFQDAEKAIQERAKKIMDAKAEEIRREEEKLRDKFKGEQLQEKLKHLEEVFKRESREKAEKKNSFLETGLIVAGAEVGVAIGLAATAAGGPLCMGVGAVVGGGAGAIVGVLAPAVVKALKNKCFVQ